MRPTPKIVSVIGIIVCGSCSLFALVVLVVLVCLLSGGCKDATLAQWGAMGAKHRITVYSGGVAVKTFHSTGNVSNQEKSDGYYFEDADTKKLVEVSGTVVVEQE